MEIPLLYSVVDSSKKLILLFILQKEGVYMLRWSSLKSVPDNMEYTLEYTNEYNDKMKFLELEHFWNTSTMLKVFQINIVSKHACILTTKLQIR